MRLGKWQKMSLRAMFVLITLLCVGIAGFLSVYRQAREQQLLEEALLIKFDANMPWIGVKYEGGTKFVDPSRRPLIVSYRQKVRGVFLNAIAPVDEVLQTFNNVESIREVYLLETDLDNNGMALLARMPGLHSLRLGGGFATRKGVESLLDSKSLKILQIDWLSGVDNDEWMLLMKKKPSVQIRIGPQNAVKDTIEVW
jgi:hypothetical protein